MLVSEEKTCIDELKAQSDIDKARADELEVQLS